MLKIGLLNPALQDNNGVKSTNTGDLIIFDSVKKVLDDIFKDYHLINIATHSFPDRKLLKELRSCDFKIIGGTNILSSDIKTYNQWKFKLSLFDKMFLPIKNIITLGVGWWQYQAAPTSHTIRYYKNLLSSSLLHSVRDSYTQSKMLEMGFSNVINTTCPTLWGLSGMNVNRKNTKKQDCVFTLTDYNPSEVLDTKLLEILLDNFSGKLYFFAQGSKDLEYINSLEFYKKNKGRFDMISTLVDYNYILKTEVVFVGTRLHAGARALQNGVDTLVVEVDNRTTEIRKDTNYPSIERDNFKTLQKWLDGETVFDNLQIDANSINTWKSQFINQKI